MKIVDLSIPVNEETRVASIDTGISDPVVRFKPWLEIAHKGFRVTKIEMGAHAGTHCDVAAHWVEDGRSITDYPTERWVGWAVVMDFRGNGPISVDKLQQYKRRIYNRPSVIPVLLNNYSDVLTEAARRELLSWNIQAIVMGEGTNIDENMEDSSTFLKADVCMIMNVDYKAAAQVQDNDLIVALPIKFIGLEAAPARVIAIRGLVETGVPGFNTPAPTLVEYESKIAQLERKVGQLAMEIEMLKSS